MSGEKILRGLAEVVIDGEPEKAAELARQALDQGLDPLTCIDEGLAVGMSQVGELFGRGDCFLPDLVLAGEAMKAALGVLEPALAGDKERRVVGRVVLGTVQGDIHEIGKTLVGTMLTANGFEVTDIGFDKSPDDFLEAVRETNATLIGASALLTTTMLQQQKIIHAVEEAGLRDRVKVMVGGAPVTPEWAEKIGADGYAEDAIAAVDVAKRLIDASR